jgi:hypothetical protein
MGGQRKNSRFLGDFQERIYHVSVVAWMERSEIRGLDLEASQSWIPFHFIQATGSPEGWISIAHPPKTASWWMRCAYPPYETTGFT